MADVKVPTRKSMSCIEADMLLDEDRPIGFKPNRADRRRLRAPKQRWLIRAHPLAGLVRRPG